MVKLVSQFEEANSRHDMGDRMFLGIELMLRKVSDPDPITGQHVVLAMLLKLSAVAWSIKRLCVGVCRGSIIDTYDYCG